MLLIFCTQFPTLSASQTKRVHKFGQRPTFKAPSPLTMPMVFHWLLEVSANLLQLRHENQWHPNSIVTRNRVSLKFHCQWKSSATRFNVAHDMDSIRVDQQPKINAAHSTDTPKTTNYPTHSIRIVFKQENALDIQIRERCVHNLQKDLHSYMVAQHADA